MTDPIAQLKYELVNAGERQARAAAPRKAGSRRPWRAPAGGQGFRARFLIAGAGLAVAAVVAVLISTITGSTTNAYAIDSQPDGSVTVHIASLRDAAGLQAALQDRGIPAVVDYSATCQSVPAPPSGVQAPARAPGTFSMGGAGAPMDGGVRVTVSKDANANGVTFTIDTNSVPAGQSVYITAHSGEINALLIRVGSKAPTPPCPPAAP